MFWNILIILSSSIKLGFIRCGKISISNRVPTNELIVLAFTIEKSSRMIKTIAKSTIICYVEWSINSMRQEKNNATE